MTISLEKRTEDAEASLISLLKKQQDRGVELGELVAQVEIAIDYSGSMMSRYRGRGGAPGEVQTVVERALALSLSGLDDDGVVPVHFFHHQAFPPVAVDRTNYEGFVDRWAAGNRMGGTAYGPTIRAVLGSPPKAQRRTKLFRRSEAEVPAPAGPDPARLEAEKDEPPTFVIFVTDGAPADQRETVELLVQASSRPIFWQFIGLGYSPRFLGELDTMGGRTVDNVGLTEFKDTLEMSDQQFFDAIISEFFGSWLPQARQLGITRR